MRARSAPGEIRNVELLCCMRAFQLGPARCFPEWACRSDQNAVTQSRILLSTIESMAVNLKVMALPTRAASQESSIRYVLNCFKVVLQIIRTHTQTQNSGSRHSSARCPRVSIWQETDRSKRRERERQDASKEIIWNADEATHN